MPQMFFEISENMRSSASKDLALRGNV